VVDAVTIFDEPTVTELLLAINLTFMPKELIIRRRLFQSARWFDPMAGEWRLSAILKTFNVRNDPPFEVGQAFLPVPLSYRGPIRTGSGSDRPKIKSENRCYGTKVESWPVATAPVLIGEALFGAKTIL